ncbi:MAG: 6-phosphogluconate dehydrogenase [Puniceicoccaceae bacterium 5H]|nr:MAG: 6-phosphogluconate dehydrogenase [Puniceicoccaceae bacterium 5H]
MVAYKTLSNLKNAADERLDAAWHGAAGPADHEAPLVLIGHGVTANKDRPWAQALAERLSAAGFDVLRFSFAGNGESEGDYREATITKEVNDLRAVIDQYADRKLYYVGHSMGGAVGTLTIGRDRRIRGFVSLAGMVETKRFVTEEFGDLKPGRDVMWDEPAFPLSQAFVDDLTHIRSTLPHAADVHCPTLVVHGTEDDVVPIREGRAFYEALSCSKAWHRVEGGDHMFSDAAQDDMTAVVAAWLQQQAGMTSVPVAGIDRDKLRIGLVGVGRMGANIARHLQFDCGYCVNALYDVNRDAAQNLAAELDTQAVEKLSDVTAACDLILTVVTNDAAMRTIFFGDDDNLLQGAAGKTFLNCATVTPSIHQEVELAAKGVGAFSLEAPMASSIPQARNGTLFLMVGGEQEIFSNVRPLLTDMSSSLYYTGPAGTAAMVKALVNMVMNINTAGLAEGLGLAEALGLDLQMVKKIFGSTGANSRVLETDGDDMIARDHETFFSAAHAAKDSGIALQLALQNGLSLPLAAATRMQYEKLTEIGLGHLDKSSVAELTFKQRHASQSCKIRSE